MATTGATLIEVLRRSWLEPFTTKSDYARLHADVVGMAASDGYLTTKIATGVYGHSWQITATGIDHLTRLTGYHG